MRPPLRRVLADSHVAAVAIALFLLWSLDAAFRALWPPVFDALRYVFTAVAILGIPYPSFPSVHRSMLIVSLAYVYNCIISLSAAWLLSRRIYGMGPFRALISLCSGLIRRKHA